MQTTPPDPTSSASVLTLANHSLQELRNETLGPYRRASWARALWQILSTLTAYLAGWTLLVIAVQWSWWCLPPLLLLQAGLLVRLFVIQHDCGHGSFFPSSRWNQYCGRFCSVLTWTPFGHWRSEHGQHHATTGNLDRRGVGDIWTMTVDEYRAASSFQRLCYRVARHPLTMLLAAPVLVFLIRQRWPSSWARGPARRSVWMLDLMLIAKSTAVVLLLGWPFLVIELAMIAVAGAAGIWLFYVQHQFEDAYWATESEWNVGSAALTGSSYFKLPKILQWFSGNIGFHHIHHLSARIPNYYLERCHRAHACFESVPTISLKQSFATAGLRLWDPERGKLVSFRHLREAQHTHPTLQGAR